MSLLKESDRLAAALQDIPSVALPHRKLTQEFSIEWEKPKKDSVVCIELGKSLWQTAVQDTQNGNLDDRPLYWSRLATQLHLGNTPTSAKTEFENHSRNFIAPLSETERDQVVLTGFDPFALDARIDQSNPSGVFALSMHGTQIEGLEVRSMIFPVRYHDFDEGCIERVLTPILQDPRVKMLITVSMGRENFDLERFPARCRGSQQPDNAGQIVAPGDKLESIPNDAPAFVEFSLPVDNIRFRLSSFDEITVNDNRVVETSGQGRFSANNLDELRDQQPIAGSGGNFLSNEISYRSLVLKKQLKCSIPVGHIHVPRMLGHDPVAIDHNLRAFKQLVSQILSRL